MDGIARGADMSIARFVTEWTLEIAQGGNA